MNDLAERIPMREKIYALENAMRAGPTVELPVKHYFAYGVYGRELFIPKGVTCVGKIHKYSQLNILMSGDISVLTDEGIKRVTPPFAIVSPPGTKRVGYAHEDTLWLTVHGTEETDLVKIESTFIAQDDAEYLSFCKALTEGKT